MRKKAAAFLKTIASILLLLLTPAAAFGQSGIDMVPIRPGIFGMGSATDEAGRYNDETLHQVRIDRAFSIARCETTNAEAARVFSYGLARGRIAYEPGDGTLRFGTIRLAYLNDADCRLEFGADRIAVEPGGYERHPVVAVTWYGAILFCNLLSELENKTPAYRFSGWACDFDADGYRLPTEAEWEYACRAGTIMTYPWGVADDSAGRANSSGGADGYAETAPVGSFPANPWGLADMNGNVWEWCNDWYERYTTGARSDPRGPVDGRYRVIRGGAWNLGAGFLRSAARGGLAPENRYNFLGFRVVRP